MLENLAIAQPTPGLAENVQARLDNKTKPPGSLGRLEHLVRQMACAQNSPEPKADPAHLLLFAADHGLVAEGVSAWPSEVTAQMVLNFLSGGAASNVFAATNGVEMTIVDGGVVGELPNHPDLLRANIARGTQNALHEDAMSEETLTDALQFGADLAASKLNDGAKVIALGEMGIGNTSSATLLAHALTDIEISDLAGPGAGLDNAGLQRKIDILKQVAARRPGPMNPWDALRAFGGLEISMMTGAMISTAANNGVVLVDGFIASASALVAIKARPECREHLVFAHRSKEPGHRLMLEAMNADPLMDLDLRLGEGTGALLAIPLLRNACAMLADMATFDSAGVSSKSET